MAKPMVNVLVIIPTLDVGGVEMDLVRTLPLIDRRRFDISVLTFRGRGLLADQLDAKGIRVLTAPNHGPAEPDEAGVPPGSQRRQCPPARKRAIRTLRGPLLAVADGARIARRLRDPNIDVIHTVLPISYLVGTFGNLVARRPLVMSRVSLNWYQQGSPTWRLLERYFLHRGVNVAIGNSRAVLQDLRSEGIPDAKLRLVHNGIDSIAFARTLLDQETARARLGCHPAELIMSVVANLHTYKGHADLLHALSEVRKRLPPRWMLLAAGADVAGNKALLEQRAAELGLSNHVHFLGQRADVPTILSAADIHLSASHTESFPNNILEAMCAGLPIIATNVGGVPEQLADGCSGILVPARAPHELAAAIGRLAGDRELRVKLGRAARDRVARAFPIEPVVAAFEDIYGSLAKPRDGSVAAAGPGLA